MQQGTEEPTRIFFLERTAAELGQLCAGLLAAAVAAQSSVPQHSQFAYTQLFRLTTAPTGAQDAGSN
jgi:hypothetical protein